MIFKYFRPRSAGRVGTRRRDRAGQTDAGLPWLVGAPLIMIITLSGGASLWFGWKIDKDLDALARNRQELIRATEVNRDLSANRERLAAQENITRKGAVLGLFPPTAAQIRKP